MTKKEFSALLARLESLSASQQAKLRDALVDLEHSYNQPESNKNIKHTAHCCPGCKGGSVSKWGMANGLQRYRCKDCGRTFNALTGTPMARLRKKELWQDYSRALADSLSLAKSAERCGIDRSTAFRWRRRFLRLPTPSPQELPIPDTSVQSPSEGTV